MKKSSTFESAQFPKFEFEMGHYSDFKFGCIYVGNEIIFQLFDFNEFYKSLGYSVEMNSDGILPEEFIWNVYHKDGANKSDACLQAKIITYLCKKNWI
jgi:hypothetical protein